ncbi:maleylpyruvate isomerase family mycothiol-dependent enzyme [Kitasatospora sp. DSM 101779]|uniref:maleylpyruvate isomerase family mycothiol-dependent enzyme n=1 Tax=Kitasatospora sp. DSM 101779 TaxID=2853165 RepID=UPI0021D9FB53|nr:maleylpyruvate isomerase family mycothiol-dependent enzyme [Kitasatospora sp. DSM 101779]MCU7820563.1 maleylpyruvate isomerase family mycothiol-dependent enzyme [Kitasatospora sp. DSM 101779]
MDNARYLECLAADFARLRSVVPIAPAAAVPTCPGWTVTDLARHVGAVYLHKIAAMREGAEPEQWPPKGLDEEEPLALLDRAYQGLLAEFAARRPEDPAGSWYTPDRSVGFWIRRMAQETVIHRIDAELGAGQRVAPVPQDLAVDGIDELLKVFVAYSVAEWGDYFTEVLDASPGRSYEVRTVGATWRVRSGPGLFTVEDGTAGDPPDVIVSGPPAAVLRWVWNRQDGDPAPGLTVEGDRDAVAELKRCIVTATQ